MTQEWTTNEVRLLCLGYALIGFSLGGLFWFLAVKS